MSVTIFTGGTVVTVYNTDPPPPPTVGLFSVGSQTFATLQAAHDSLPATGGAIGIAGNPTFQDETLNVTNPNVTITGPATFTMATIQGKACIVQSAPNLTLNNISAAGFAVSSNNGAFIRHGAPGLTWNVGSLTNCQDGILGDNSGPTDTHMDGDVVNLTDLAVSACGIGDGFTHNLYFGYARNSVLNITRGSSINCNAGHLIKTRMAKAVIDGVTLTKGPASRFIDFCGGGDVTIRNCVCTQDQQTANSEYFGYGTEPTAFPRHPLDSFVFEASNVIHDHRSPAGLFSAWGIQPTVKTIGAYTLDISPAPPPPPPTNITVPFPAGGTTDAWWAALPLMTWVEVLGTSMGPSITADLPTGFKDYGSNPVQAIMSNWSGGALDQATGDMAIFGGGHFGGSYNGVPCFNWETMQTRILMPPSIVSQADINASTASWGTNWTGYSDGYIVGADYWLNPNRPCATHTYNAVAITATEVIFPGLVNWWHINRATGVATQGAKLNGTAGGWAAGMYMTVDETKGAQGQAVLFSNIDYDYGKINVYDIATKTEIPTASVGKWNYVAVWGRNGRKVYNYDMSAHTATAFDLDTHANVAVALDAPPLVDQPLQGSGAYVPSLGVVFQCASGALATMNFSTGHVGALAVAGVAPTTRDTNNGNYGRFAYYARRNAIVCQSDTAYNAKVIRLA